MMIFLSSTAAAAAATVEAVATYLFAVLSRSDLPFVGTVVDFSSSCHCRSACSYCSVFVHYRDRSF